MTIIIDLVGQQPHIEGRGEVTIITTDARTGGVPSVIAKITPAERPVIGAIKRGTVNEITLSLSLIHI